LIEKLTEDEIHQHSATKSRLVGQKLNELIEASNRQDRAIAFIILNHEELMNDLRYRSMENDLAKGDLRHWESYSGKR
jgi:hypothetical protein